ncbi:Wall-associated receptor kinase 3 [Hordeum vulgare]|nr:Wall-associated receptor kinase 3 [Hordeum vulgare]
MPMCMSKVTVIHGADQDAQEGCDGAARVVCVDWDSVQLEDTTDLVIAPMVDTEMAKLFGIRVDPVDDQDEEERGESTLPNDANIDACEDVDGQLMKDVADDVDNAHNDELVSVYDKENPVIEVGKLFPSMKEFRMCFKTYAFKHEFDAKTLWTDRNKIYARCKAAVDATTTPDNVALLRESILANQTPNHQGAMPSRSVAFNVQDEAPLHRRKHPLVPRTRVHLQE